MKILTTPHPFLRHTARPLTSLTNKVSEDISKMISLLQAARDPEGIGLAATQVGLDTRIFILLDQHKNPSIYINPTILSSSKLTTAEKYPDPKKQPLEGCLSIPQIWGFVNRPYRIKVKYQTFDINSNSHTLKTVQKKLEGFRSIAFQHETDHLNGILFTDHILKQKGTFLKKTSF